MSFLFQYDEVIMMRNSAYALLINDMQNDFVLPDSAGKVSGAYETVPTLKNLLSYCRNRGHPIFHLVREYREDGSDIEITRLEEFLTGDKYAIPGSIGCEIVKELEPINGEYRIVRNRFSAFMQTELDFILRRLGVSNLIICGTQYPNCVRATAFDGICYGYNVTVVTDATSAEADDIAEANIIDMKNIGIECTSLEVLKIKIQKSGD